MDTKIYPGILTKEKQKIFLLDTSGKRHFENDTIWEGYSTHWLGMKVNARHLPQKDYETGKNIIIIWPEKNPPDQPYVELYYNERLTKYPLSVVGHLAINVNGEIFNYSHLINENERITEEEYFYRPALGEFAPDPVTGLYNIQDKVHPYYDKFGRSFMRTVHVLRIEGLDTLRLGGYYKNVLKEMINSPDAKRPELCRDFNVLKKSCVTIIRDGLRRYGFKKLRGFFPRDFFIRAAYYFLSSEAKNRMRITLFRMPQLKVPDAPYSALTLITNPINMILLRKLPDY